MAESDNEVAERAEIKVMLRGIAEQVATLVALERSVTEMLVRDESREKQITTLWAKFDTTQQWQTDHDKGAQARIEKLTDYLDKRLEKHSELHEKKHLEMLANIAKAQVVADNAASESSALVNQIKGATRATKVMWAAMGGGIGLALIYMVNTTVDNSKQLALVDQRLRAIEAAHVPAKELNYGK